MDEDEGVVSEKVWVLVLRLCLWCFCNLSEEDVARKEIPGKIFNREIAGERVRIRRTISPTERERERDRNSGCAVKMNHGHGFGEVPDPFNPNRTETENKPRNSETEKVEPIRFRGLKQVEM